MKNSQMVTVKELSDKKRFCLCGKKSKQLDFIYEKVTLRNNCTAAIVMLFFLFMIFCAVSIITNNFFIETLTLCCFAGEVVCGVLLFFQLYDSKKYSYRITAVKKEGKKFVKYYVYTSWFDVFNDGTFNCGINEKVPVYYSDTNEILNQWEKRWSSFYFDFYIEVYDLKEKKYISNQELDSVFSLSATEI